MGTQESIKKLIKKAPVETRAGSNLMLPVSNMRQIYEIIYMQKKLS
jgi:hypothetical protein